MEALLISAQEAARKAASLVMQYYGNALIERKTDNSPVTEADTHAHELIMDELSATKIPVLSEEGTLVAPPYPQDLWIIDPIDGTVGFIKGTGDFAIMIGLLRAGKPILGVVHLPAINTQYYAVKGEGAYRLQDGVSTKLSVSDRHVPNLFATGSKNHKAPYMAKVAELLKVTGDVRVGGIGIKTSVIAEGKADYFLTLGELGEWDMCAPHIIAEEAGGRVTDREGNPLVYGNPHARFLNGIIVSNSSCHNDVVAALREATH